MKNYANKNYLYINNFYTSPKLLQDLEKKSIYICGTVRQDSGKFPPNFRQAKLGRGESKYLKLGNILAVHWFDKRDVFALSTIHGTGDVQVKRRGDENSFDKPIIINEYNKHMGGADQCDQLISTYAMNRKSIKWWKVFF